MINKLDSFYTEQNSNGNEAIKLQSIALNTPLGPMYAIADEKALYALGFSNDSLEWLSILGCIVEPRDNPLLRTLALELEAYFGGELYEFTTPYRTFGTVFQKQVWAELVKTPYGQTRSYKEEAQALGKPTAYRAVANANGKNRLAIIVPCHRIVASDGALGGYSSGIAFKQWLLNHEKLHGGTES